jgi:hypothetical protein
MPKTPTKKSAVKSPKKSPKKSQKKMSPYSKKKSPKKMSPYSKKKSPKKMSPSKKKSSSKLVKDMSYAEYLKYKRGNTSISTKRKKCNEEGRKYSGKTNRCLQKKSSSKKSKKRDYAGIESVAAVDNVGIVAPVSLVNNDFIGVTVEYLKKLASCDSAGTGTEQIMRDFLGSMKTSDLIGIRDALNN